MAQHNELGKWGEDVAADYLVRHGYSIVERNWTFGHKEVDIIATNGQMLLFIEVKTRRNDNYGNPYQAVDWKKQRNLMKAMRHYVSVNKVSMPVRFDIVSVIGEPECYRVEQYENAVSNFMY